MKSNGNLVKFILEQIYKCKQLDTVMDTSNLTIEHLKSDDGTLNNASIWNLTLTTAEINSDELKDKDIIDKINILKEKSTIKENQCLDKYLNGYNFDFDKRKKDLLNTMFENIFRFEPEQFGITKNDINTYRRNQHLLEIGKDFELLDLLKKLGTNFEVKLRNDPSLSELSNRWNNSNEKNSYV